MVKPRPGAGCWHGTSDSNRDDKVLEAHRHTIAIPPVSSFHHAQDANLHLDLAEVGWPLRTSTGDRTLFQGLKALDLNQ
jgi:hypothetical protein